MASIQAVAAGSYRVDTRVHQVVPSVRGHFEIRDLTPYFSPDGCTIERDNCAGQDHATCRLTFVFTDAEVLDVFGVPEIPWSSMRLRPSMRLVSLDGHGETDWYDLGVFLPETPRRKADENPKVYAVDCHDLISSLALPTAGTFIGSTGASVVDVLGTLFETATPDGLRLVPEIPVRWGYPDQRVLPGVLLTVRQWVIGEDTTWLLIIDQLLEMAGWRPPWVDESGTLTSEPWRDPNELPADLTLTTTRDSVVALGASNQQNLFGTPNNWVFIRSDFDPEQEAPTVENGGIVVRRNTDRGPSSVQARGRVVSSVERVDAIDVAALRAYADRAVTMDVTPARSLCLDVAPQPPPWHRGIVDVTINDLGVVSERYLVASWSLPLDGGDMSLTMDSLT